MEQLQKIINDRADARLKADIKKTITVLHTKTGHIDLKELGNNVRVSIPGEGEEALRSAIWSSDNSLGKFLTLKYREIYRKEETENFVNEVSELRERVDNLGLD